MHDARLYYSFLQIYRKKMSHLNQKNSMVTSKSKP